jgi:Flp pilus assembly protein TadD/ketosteroid isomerase-like protein
MPPIRITVFRTLSLFTLVAVLGLAQPALADEYAEVNSLLSAGRTSEALSKTDQLLASRPRDPQLRFLRGVILAESGRSAEAVNVFVKLTEDYPELPEPYNNLAVLYANQNQFDKSRITLEMAIRTNPSYATAHENLGDIYARLASQAYSRALQLDSGNAAIQPKLALIRELFSFGRTARSPAAAAAAVSTPVVAQAQIAPATPLPPAPARPAPSTPAPSTPAPSTAPAAEAAPAPRPAPPPVAAAAPADSAPPTPAASAAAPNEGGVRDVEAAVQAWAAAWSAKNMADYLGAYGKDFAVPGKQSRKAWEEERRLRIVGKASISVKVSELQVKVEGDKAVASFRQAYKADSLSVSGRKRLNLQKVGGRWLIVNEVSGS